MKIKQAYQVRVEFFYHHTRYALKHLAYVIKKSAVHSLDNGFFNFVFYYNSLFIFVKG